MYEAIKDISIKIANYKSIDDVPQGFDKLCPINLVIGRNNSGKSTLLDLIERFIKKDFSFPQALWHNGIDPVVYFEAPLLEKDIRQVFREEQYGGGVPGNTHWDYGKLYVGKKLKKIIPSNAFIELEPYPSARSDINNIQNSQKYKEALSKNLTNPLENKTIQRLHAERNILPEPHTADIQVNGHGSGATNIIQNFINNVALPSELVEKVLLDAINKVCGKDAHFDRIVCQLMPENNWEIFLEQEHKGRIPLSHTGSGFKTIILALVYIHLLPHALKKELNQFVFAFEELENNLHPALLRSLLMYLRELAVNKGCLIFLTTHSNVAIDLLSHDEHAQIVHVTHDGKRSEARTIKTYIDNRGILDDLDVRASDLLQSNGIIWVEGPSDRLYMNKWISLWSDGELAEGTHYQCIFYGGRLLSHLTLDDPNISAEEQALDWITLLSANRNAIILMDSDKRSKQTPINDTKKRILDEVAKMSGIAWITKGKEVENYLPATAVNSLLGIVGARQVEQYEDFFDCLNDILPGKGSYYSVRKPLLAERVSRFITKEHMETILDLAEMMDATCSRIRQWNGL